MAKRINNRLSSRSTVGEIYQEAIRKFDESVKLRTEIYHRSQKEVKYLKPDGKLLLSEAISSLGKTLEAYASPPGYVDLAKKTSDFQRWLEDYRSQLTTEVDSILTIPTREYIEEDLGVQKSEQRKLADAKLGKKETVDTDGMLQDAMSVLSATSKKNELKTLLKLHDYLAVYKEFFSKGLSKIAELDASLASVKDSLVKDIEKANEETRRSRLSNARKGSVFSADFQRDKVFGGDLVDILARDQTEIPRLLLSAISYLTKHSLKTEGIFRIGAVQDDLKHMSSKIDSGEPYDLENCSSEHTVSGLIKLFLRIMPEPLITHELFDRVIQCSTIDDPEKRIAELKKLVHMLPASHRACLRSIFVLCRKIAHYSEINLMTFNNLSIVISPNILRMKDESSNAALIENMNRGQNLTTFMMENYAAIFSPNVLEAALSGDVENLQDMIAKGADLNDKDSNGATVMHRAVIGGHLDVIELLLQKNSGLLKAIDSHGRTPTQLAEEMNTKHYEEVANVLKKAETKMDSKWLPLEKKRFNVTAKEEEMSSTPRTPRSREPAKQEEEVVINDPRIESQTMEQMLPNPPIYKTAFTVVNISEITDIISQLVGLHAAETFDVAEAQKLMRNVLNAFKNMTTSCRTFAETCLEQEKKSILQQALDLQGKLRVLMTGVKAVSSAPTDPASREPYVAACTQLLDGLQKLVDSCELAGDGLFVVAVTEHQQYIAQMLSAVRANSVDNFAKGQGLLVGSTFKITQIARIKSFALGSLEHQIALRNACSALEGHTHDFIDAGKSILQRPKTSQLAPMIQVEKELQATLKEVKDLASNEPTAMPPPGDETELFSRATHYVQDAAVELKNEEGRQYLAALSGHINEFTKCPTGLHLIMRTNQLVDTFNAFMQVVASKGAQGVNDQLKLNTYSEAVSHCTSKLRMAAAASTIDFQLLPKHQLVFAVSDVAAIIGSSAQFLNSLL